MYITVHEVGGRKITKDESKLVWFSAAQLANAKSPVKYNMPPVKDGCITVNLDNVLDIRPADEEELASAKLHGW